MRTQETDRSCLQNVGELNFAILIYHGLKGKTLNKLNLWSQTAVRC